MSIGELIARNRKELGYTQQKLAEQLCISFQAVSKWENGSSLPDVTMLPQLADILHTSVDALVGHHYSPQTIYEEKYSDKAYYWGIEPNCLCYDILRLRPPVRPYRVLDIGCGEGKDAVFLARNGYRVSAFDISDAGLNKARQLAHACCTHVDLFRADLLDYHPDASFDIVFSSGVLHYLPFDHRKDFFERLKASTAPHGLHVMNVFVHKPFIAPAPDAEESELVEPWLSGELFSYYHDWRFHLQQETIFDCISGGMPHQHCMVRMIAEKVALQDRN